MLFCVDQSYQFLGTNIEISQVITFPLVLKTFLYVLSSSVCKSHVYLQFSNMDSDV